MQLNIDFHEEKYEGKVIRAVIRDGFLYLCINEALKAIYFNNIDYFRNKFPQ